MKLIKNLIKVIIINSLVITLNIFNIAPSFAEEKESINNHVETIQDFCNKYGVQYNGYVDTVSMVYEVSNEKLADGTQLTKFNNGSWYSSNENTHKYTLKIAESNNEINFNNDDITPIYCVSDYKNVLYNIKKIPQLIDTTGSSFFQNIGSHSSKIYTDNLSTNEKLQDYAEQWLKDNYNITSNVIVSYQKIDIKGDYGVFICKQSGEKYIYISEDIQGFDTIIERTLQHELTHIALFEMKKPFDDGTNNFTKECIKNGGVTNDGQTGIFHSNLKCTL